MPEGHRQVVVNATPLISLALIDKLDLLRDLYGQVLVPGAVYAEVALTGQSSMGRVEVPPVDWLEVVQLRDSRSAALVTDLDRGEAEVIALALELDADLVIIDERLARRHAKRLGLKLTGTLGVLLRAKHSGLVPALKPLTTQLKEGGVHISDQVVAEVLNLAGEH